MHRPQARLVSKAGARCVIVSGVVDAAYRVHADVIPRAALTVCRLRADRAELARRFVGRHRPSDDLDEVLKGDP